MILDGQEQGPRGDGATVRVKVSTNVAPVLPDVGETWDFEGDLTETAWGPQLAARSAVRRVPSGKLATAFLSRSVDFH
ncbi:hypothetical protein [Aurantimonas sp. Leaf443]|uniref:hypothetical protein n=1 Tax=Aurantimonas sp. Leaf443 TaxID=1736378 RepID=UPI0012E38AB8|nr:hypothetical protein [Aurantimonas sp. Leaf443]